MTAKPKGSRANKQKKGLSQKARGKQRAIEVEEGSQHPATASNEEVPSGMDAPPASQDQSQSDHQVPPFASQEALPEQSQGPTSYSPRRHALDSVQSSQSPSTSLLFGGSSQLNEGLPPSSQPVNEEVSPPKRKGSTPITVPDTFEEFEALYISPSLKCSQLPSTGESSSASTAILPDSQEDKQANDTIRTAITLEEDTSALTDLSKLTDYSNASISEILHMPFCSQESSISEGDADTSRQNAPILTDFPSLALTEEEKNQKQDDGQLLSSQSQQGSQPAPLKQIQIQRFLTVPRVIPLHGTLDEMHCPKCNHIEPLERHISILESGHSIHCPKCLEQDFSRTALGERSRGVGVLKVSVVLYGEEHKQASRVGEIAEKDLLKAARPDVLLVAGTTLRIPGVKKIVKELAKVIKQPIREPIKDDEGNPTGEYTEREDPTKRVIFVNRDPPNPERTWSEVFDTFVQGDAQAFAKLLRQEIQALKNPVVTAKAIPTPSLAAPAAQTTADIVAEVTAAILAQNNKAAPSAQVQTSLTSCWSASKKGKAAPPASQKATNASVGPSLSMAEHMLMNAPIKLADALASHSVQIGEVPSVISAPVASMVTETPQASQSVNLQSAKPKVAKAKGPKAGKEPKKITGTKQTQKQKLLAPKAPSPQAAPASLEASAKPQPKQKAVKVKRPPIKSLAKVRAEQAARVRAAQKAALAQQASSSTTAPAEGKKEKPKTRPGWRGYAELAEGEELKPKFADFEKPEMLEGRRRRTSVLPVQTQPQRKAPSTTAAPVKEESARESTPTNADQATMNPADIPSFTFSPLKGSNWPDSAHPSIASTPPSLDSDRDAFSDSDETASYKGEYEVSVSQETTCVPPTLSAEEGVASLPSSGQLDAQSARESSSSPIIVENSLSMEEAASISAISSSQSPVHVAKGKNKRSASSSQAGPFLTSCIQAVKRAAPQRPSRSKRTKMQA